VQRLHQTNVPCGCVCSASTRLVEGGTNLIDAGYWWCLVEPVEAAAGGLLPTSHPSQVELISIRDIVKRAYS
jgi:hypothetical protein